VDHARISLRPKCDVCDVCDEVGRAHCSPRTRVTGQDTVHVRIIEVTLATGKAIRNVGAVAVTCGTQSVSSEIYTLN
jgi:hypothetical protein